ncbi:MAG: hypothetical protein HN411_00965 [Waddliaceae bacterium]|jgi:hypothetical protein|nr:hypothetical protein [Waddliaceae bacterium]MBT3579021.1 hypothetical protein [Waddliaceae bacterium]MBT4445130.1 hypothetical protein [Waddliaceae bacterium]MBT6929163.1 hypothetical protein [Waddliaceae bacterium]MBT7264235.1 hypothetical protein [Waddliaceae bacterium]
MNLVSLYVVVKTKSLIDYLYTVSRYYIRSWRYALADTMIIAAYLWRSPFRIHKNFLIKKGEKDVYTYGETPILTMKKIAEECNITADDTFVELGSGRGRTVLWVNIALGCKSRGIEIVPFFVDNAARICKTLKFHDVIFSKEDMLSCDIIDATVVYLYEICLEDTILEAMTKKFASLPLGAKVITVSAPLEAPYLPVTKTFTAKYPWGDAEVFIHRKQ